MHESNNMRLDIFFHLRNIRSTLNESKSKLFFFPSNCKIILVVVAVPVVYLFVIWRIVLKWNWKETNAISSFIRNQSFFFFFWWEKNKKNLWHFMFPLELMHPWYSFIQRSKQTGQRTLNKMQTYEYIWQSLNNNKNC